MRGFIFLFHFMEHTAFLSYCFSGEKTDVPEKRCDLLNRAKDVCSLTGEVCEYVSFVTRFPYHTFKSAEHYHPHIGCFFAELRLKSRDTPSK